MAGTKVRKMENRQYDFRTETRGDEERGLLENPENPGCLLLLAVERFELRRKNRFRRREAFLRHAGPAP